MPVVADGGWLIRRSAGEIESYLRARRAASSDAAAASIQGMKSLLEKHR